MLKKTIEYTDYNGNTRKEDFFFNFTEAEITELDLSKDGGLETLINRITSSQNGKEIVDLFKEIIYKAYGVKSDDGRKFIKTEEVKQDFIQTEAYSILFMELATDADAAAKFINGVIPKKKENNVTPIPTKA